MNISLTNRIGLAVTSGIGVGILLTNNAINDMLGEGLAYYALSGLVFAAGVLFPYLKRDNRILFRAIALAIASAASYYSAVWLALEGPFSGPDGWISFTIGSVAGAAIVMTAFVLATPTRAMREYVLFGLAAGLVGGPITNTTLPSENTILVYTGYAIWHTLICLAILFGTRSQGRTEIPD